MAHNITSAAPTHVGIQGIVLYPSQPYLVIVLALLVVGCFQWGGFFHTKFNSRRRSVRDEESAQPSRRGASVFSIPLAVVNVYRVFAFRTTIGFRSYAFNLAEVFATVAYVTVLIVWTFVITYDPDGEPLNWSSRAGLLAASQFPLITVLGTKNNIISIITHISADRLNLVHRLAARACLIFILLHAIGGGNNFSFYGPASNECQLFGIVAASVFAVLTVVSFRPVRERVYELFFYLHFVAVIVIMCATIIHIQNFSGASFTYYIWPSFVVWGADRLIRTGRLIYFNLGYFGFGKKSSVLDATTELLSDGLVRFAYLIMPSVSRIPFEAHPFSIASVDSALFAPDARVAEDTSCGKELVFFIGVKNGFTRHLKNAAARGERVKVYIDGPYGQAVNLGCYDTSLLIAGGTGVTFTLPALLNIIESVRNGSSCCRRVVFIWSIRDTDFLGWVSESLIKAIRFAPPELKVDIQVFLTKSHPTLSSTVRGHRINSEATESNLPLNRNPFVNPSDSFDEPKETILTAPWLKLTSGRPNLKLMLSEEISAASGKVFVSVCGPNAMTKDVRRALRLPWWNPSSPLNGGPSVTLHVECFGYA